VVVCGLELNDDDDDVWDYKRERGESTQATETDGGKKAKRNP